MRKPFLSLAAVVFVATALRILPHRAEATSQAPDPQHHQPTYPPPAPAASAYDGNTFKDPGKNPVTDTDEDHVSTFAMDVEPPHTRSPNGTWPMATCPIPPASGSRNGSTRSTRAMSRRAKRRSPSTSTAPRPVRARMSAAPGRHPGPPGQRSGPAARRRPDLRHRHVRIDGARGRLELVKDLAAQARPFARPGDSSRSSPSATRRASS